MLAKLAKDANHQLYASSTSIDQLLSLFGQPVGTTETLTSQRAVQEKVIICFSWELLASFISTIVLCPPHRAPELYKAASGAMLSQDRHRRAASELRRESQEMRL